MVEAQTCETKTCQHLLQYKFALNNECKVLHHPLLFRLCAPLENLKYLSVLWTVHGWLTVVCQIKATWLVSYTVNICNWTQMKESLINSNMLSTVLSKWVMHRYKQVLFMFHYSAVPKIFNTHTHTTKICKFSHDKSIWSDHVRSPRIVAVRRNLWLCHRPTLNHHKTITNQVKSC